MGDGEMASMNLKISIFTWRNDEMEEQVSGEMTRWINCKMVNDEITIDKCLYGETERNIIFITKWIYRPFITWILTGSSSTCLLLYAHYYLGHHKMGTQIYQPIFEIV